MSIKGCSFDNEDDVYSFAAKLPVEINWNGHKFINGGESLAHLIQGHQIISGSMKNQIRPLSGSAGASAEGKTNSDGNSIVKAEAHVSAKDDEGGKVTVTAQVEIKQDSGGVSSSGGIKVSVEKEF
jgi:hypothetical protein